MLCCRPRLIWLTVSVPGHLVTHFRSFDSEAIWQGFGEDEEDSDDSDDGDDIAVDSQQALPSSPLQPLDDDGPEHIAY